MPKSEQLSVTDLNNKKKNIEYNLTMASKRIRRPGS